MITLKNITKPLLLFVKTVKIEILNDLCEACGKSVDKAGLCNQCKLKIKPLPDTICSICGNPLQYQFKASTSFTRLCLTCKDLSFPYNENVSIFPYEDGIKNMMIALKFRNKRILAKEIIEIAADYIKPFLGSIEKPLIIPIPLSFRKTLKRGYNHAYLLAREIAKLDQKSEISLDSLVRIKHTKPQFSLGTKERKNNVKGAFQTRKPDIIYKRNVIIIDDIYTTGATMTEAAKTIKQYEPASISLLSILKSN